jgi:hypothetical protein
MRNLLLVILAIVTLFANCKKDDSQTPLDVTLNPGVFIVNQGTLSASNASLSYFDNSAVKLYNNLFYDVNTIKLGDVAQSITMHKNNAFVVVNNSGVIYAIDKITAKIKGTISNLVSPRHMLVVNDQKAYVTDLYSLKVAIVNPATYEVTGSISLGRTSEELALVGDKIFVANWLDINQEPVINDRIMIIDSNADTVSGSIQVGIEPISLVVDKNSHLWVLCTGGYNFVEKPSLWKIDGNTFDILDTITFSDLYSYPSNLEINGTGDTLFYLYKGIYKMPTDATELPENPFIMENNNREFTFLGVDPNNGDLYASNPLDNLSPGIVYRYNKKGSFISQINTGIVPAAFGFNY